MSTIRTRALVIAAALLGLTLSMAPAEAREGSSKGSPHQFCHWYKQQAMNTGEELWWWRWRECIRGRYWD
jgi:hypothetical protein